MDLIQKIIDLVSGLEGGVVVIAAGVVDFVFRLFKSEKPLSIAWLVAGAVKKLSELLVVIAGLLDKVLPQNLKKD